jgi:Putative adhesin
MLRLLGGIFTFASLVYAVDSEDHVRKALAVSAATRLTMNTEFGSINVQPGGGRSVEVEAYFRGTPPSRDEFDRMLRDFRLDVTEQGSEVRVNATFQSGWKPMSFPIFFVGHAICRNGRCLEYSSWLRDVEYRIRVPFQFSVDVATSGGPISVDGLKGEVNAHTSGGSLHFNHIDGPVTGRTSGGSITLDGVKGRTVVHTSGGSIHVSDVAGDVDASTSGGSVSVDRVSGSVRAHTSGGWISLGNAAGAIDASTSGGSVTASLLAQPQQECRLSTSGGSIKVSLSKDAHLNLDASTSGGRVSTDFPVNSVSDRHHRALRVPLNGGGPLLYLHTSGGGISVRRAGLNTDVNVQAAEAQRVP